MDEFVKVVYRLSGGRDLIFMLVSFGAFASLGVGALYMWSYWLKSRVARYTRYARVFFWAVVVTVITSWLAVTFGIPFSP